ncbi:UPF0481 protein At3g47200-like [Wolffia australiana]
MEESPESFPIRIHEQGGNNPQYIDDDNLVDSIVRRLEQITPNMSQAPICRVVSTIRDVKPSVYEPQMISIGPYHHGKERLQEMEELKLAFLADFLTRNPKKDLAACISKIREHEERIRNCYADGLRMLDSDSVVGIITIDGCFLVELIIVVSGKAEPGSWARSMVWRFDDIVSDLFLLENQVPFFVLEEIWKTLDCDLAIEADDVLGFRPLRDAGDVNLLNLFIGLAVEYSSIGLPTLDDNSPLEITQQPHHLLDLLHSIIFPRWTPPDDIYTVVNTSHIPCAVELKRKGLKFAKAEHTLNDAFLSFSDRVISMPSVYIFDDTTPQLRNLIAYEQSILEVDYKISSFAAHVDDLIETAADVAVLRESGILHCGLGSDIEIANLVNELGKGVSINRMNVVCGDINKYYNSKKVAWKAELKQNYFSSPWQATAVLAAAFLLLMTIIQTIFAVLSYTRSNPG